MKIDQYFELDENDLKEIVLELLLKKGFKPKDEITVSINTNQKTIDGKIEIGRSWGFIKNGIIVSCELVNNT